MAILAPIQPMTTLLNEEAAMARARLFAILSNHIRLQMLDVLLQSDGTMCVQDIVELFDREQSTISHHLRLLGDLGLIGHRKQGLYAYYFVHKARVEEVRGYLRGLR